MKHIAQAVRLYESFRERKPRRIADVKLKVPKAVACIGYVEGIDYRTTHGKKVTLYHHDFAPGSRPLLAVSGDGKQLLLLGGRYEFTERGIVDKDAAGREIENARHGKTINPRQRLSSKEPRDMTAGQINKELDSLDAISSGHTDAMIAAGRGHERYTDWRSKSDPLSVAMRNVSERRFLLNVEIERRYGPNPPHRLPVKLRQPARKRNPVKTLEEDAATVLRVTQRESAHFEALRAGKAAATDLPARTSAEWDAFRRYQRSMTRLAKDAFK